MSPSTYIDPEDEAFATVPLVEYLDAHHEPGECPSGILEEALATIGITLGPAPATKVDRDAEPDAPSP